MIICLTVFFTSSIFTNCDSSGSKEKELVGKSDSKENDLVGKTFNLDIYHRIEFKTSTRYWIYQKPLSCGGEGNWSVQNNKIVLGPNDSGCESTQGMKGIYEYSQLK
jgi:hypothetical protein